MSDHRPVDPAKLQRQRRLEAQLRDNLKRRKAASPSPAGEPELPRDDGRGSQGDEDATSDAGD